MAAQSVSKVCIGLDCNKISSSYKWKFKNVNGRVFKKVTMSRYTWVCDAGHGGLLNGEYQTSGKRSAIWSDGSVYYEGVGNREIAKKVGDKLKSLGISFKYTVEPSDPTDVPLSNRINYVNKLPDDNKILISIHSNGVEDTRAHGWQCHIYLNPTTLKSNPKSISLSKPFIEAFKNEFSDIKLRGKGGLIQNNLAMTRETNCPALLLENFFHTNEKECKEILMTQAGQDRIVKCIVDAIVFIEKTGI